MEASKHSIGAASCKLQTRQRRLRNTLEFALITLILPRPAKQKCKAKMFFLAGFRNHQKRRFESPCSWRSIRVETSPIRIFCRLKSSRRNGSGYAISRFRGMCGSRRNRCSLWPSSQHKSLVKMFYKFDVEAVGTVDVTKKHDRHVTLHVIFDLDQLLLVGSGVR